MLKVSLCVFSKLKEETVNSKLLLTSPVEAKGAGDAFNGHLHTYTNASIVNLCTELNIFISIATLHAYLMYTQLLSH